MMTINEWICDMEITKGSQNAGYAFYSTEEHLQMVRDEMAADDVIERGGVGHWSPLGVVMIDGRLFCATSYVGKGFEYEPVWLKKYYKKRGFLGKFDKMVGTISASGVPLQRIFQ